MPIHVTNALDADESLVPAMDALQSGKNGIGTVKCVAHDVRLQAMPKRNAFDSVDDQDTAGCIKHEIVHELVRD